MKKIIVAIICMAMVLSIANCGTKDHQEQIVDFVYERDIKDVLKIIQDDWHWLFTSKNPKYDLTYVLQTCIPNKDLIENKDKLKMKVLRNENCVIGFVTFYQTNPGTGRICLVSISQDFRKKEYDKKLVISAINDLFNLGCTHIYLYSHKKNEKVLSYQSLGFKEGELPQDDILWFKQNGIPIEEYSQYARYSMNK